METNYNHTRDLGPSKIIKVVAADVSETVNAGERLASFLMRGDVVLLSGDLGAGKTHFTKGIAKGLGIDGYIVSPTFTIVNEYRSGRLDLFHMDVYRLSSFEELQDIGFYDYLADGVTVIEWADMFGELFELPERTFAVKIRKMQGESAPNSGDGTAELADSAREIEIAFPFEIDPAEFDPAEFDPAMLGTAETGESVSGPAETPEGGEKEC